MNKKIDMTLLHFLFCLYVISCFYVSWNTVRPSFVYLFIFSAFGFLSCTCCTFFKNKMRYVLLFIPYILWILTFRDGIDGLISWINAILEQYNTLHDTGIPLLDGVNSSLGIRTFSIFFSLAQIDLLYWILHIKYKRFVSCIYLLVWAILLLNMNCFYPFLFAVFLVLALSLFIENRTQLARHWLYCMSVLILAISFVFTNTNDVWIHDIKEDTSNSIHDVRYGKEVLPAGDLMKANLLSRGQEKRLSITSSQVKDLYLKGYVGSVFKDNQWSALSGADYGYENDGMFQWLKKKDFDPFTQVSTYYSLGNDKLKKNAVSISVQSASRDYLYSVSSLCDVSLNGIDEIEDYSIRTKGVFGKNSYSWNELSTDKPYELMTSNDWLQNPTTKKQKAYIQAESVYRQFVYDHYLKVDRDLNSFLKSYFWKDYDAKENDSIYSAIQQIRKCLEANITYEPQMDGVHSKDAVSYFLSKSKTGNSAYYATAATLALRSQGIPARYVEGYFVSKESFEDKDTVQVLSKDAHAWTEIYYDGIGWVPVDFTPGFYDEAVVLQQMVSLPNTVHKTAGVHKNKSNKADEMYSKNKQNQGLKDAAKHIVNVLGILMGVVALVILVLTVLFVLFELLRIYKIYWCKKKYEKMSSDEKVLILKRFMDVFFKILNLSIYFGWNIEEEDIYLAHEIDDITQGDFKRVSQLVEKSVYGNIALQEFELRTIRLFVEKLYAYGMKQSLWTIIHMYFSILRI